MRSLLALLILTTAGVAPALAQVDPAQIARENDLWAQQQLQSQRAVGLENQLNALDARVGTELRLRDMREQSQRPVVPTYIPSTGAKTSKADPFPTIPDETLEASNRRVREASQNKR